MNKSYKYPNDDDYFQINKSINRKWGGKYCLLQVSNLPEKWNKPFYFWQRMRLSKQNS